jgi:hypothetical protein
MKIPFSELRNGLPTWHLQVEDPSGAAEAKVELASRSLDFPQGGVLALCLKLYDHPGRPALFHHAVAFGSMEQLSLSRHAGVCLVFERKGWMSDTVKELPVNFEDLPAYGEGSGALAPYLDAYRRLQSSQGPEQTWDTIEHQLQAPVAATGSPAGVKLAWILFALMVLGAAAYYYFVLGPK